MKATIYFLPLLASLYTSCDSTSSQNSESDLPPANKCSSDSVSLLANNCAHGGVDTIIDTTTEYRDTSDGSRDTIINLRPSVDGFGVYEISTRRSGVVGQGSYWANIYGQDTLVSGRYTFSALDSAFSYGPMTCSPTNTSANCIPELSSVTFVFDSIYSSPRVLRSSDYDSFDIVEFSAMGRSMHLIKLESPAGPAGAYRYTIIDSSMGVIFEENASWARGVSGSTRRFQRIRWNNITIDTMQITRKFDSLIQL